MGAGGEAVGRVLCCKGMAGHPEDPKANLQWTFAGAGCRRAQARRQGAIRLHDSPVRPQPPGQCPDLTGVKSGK